MRERTGKSPSARESVGATTKTNNKWHRNSNGRPDYLAPGRGATNKTKTDTGKKYPGDRCTNPARGWRRERERGTTRNPFDQLGSRTGKRKTTDRRETAVLA